MSKEAKSLWNVVKGTKGSTGSYEKNVQQRAAKQQAKDLQRSKKSRYGKDL